MVGNIDTVKEYFSTQPDKVLYHYTTLKGFLGIIDENKIRATNIFYVNDHSELSRAISLLTDELTSRIEPLNKNYLELEPRAIGTEINPDIIKVREKIKFMESIKDCVDNVISEDWAQFYVCSLTELNDNLNQWRGYSQDGNGVSIGFDFTTHKVGRAIAIRKCEYNEDKQKEILKYLIDRWFSAFVENIEANIASSILPELASKAVNDFFAIAPLFKHPKYQEENEWRIVVSGKSEKFYKNVKFVESNDIIKPYYCLQLNHLPPIADIRVGPSSHADLNTSTVKLLLKSKNMDNSIISKSDIPYRGKL